jgi:type VI secretion system protein ImpC
MFVRDAVRPHLVEDDTDARARIAAVDRAASQALSRLVHSPSFQHLERIWRSVVFLLSRIDTSAKVRVYLVHLPREVLSEDLSSAADPARSRLRDLLSAPDLGAPGRRWALVVGAFELGMNGDDLQLMKSIASVARSTRTPWLSGLRLPQQEHGIPPSTRDLTEVEADPPEDWNAFRTHPEAAWLGLTFPRFLLREPEKEGRRRAEPPAYQEEAASWADLLWGLGPFPVAALMAQGFATEGRDFRPERFLELGGVPMAAPEGEEDNRPRATEMPLSPERALHLMEMGIIPLVEIPQRAALRLAGLPAVGVGSPFPPRER